MRMIHVIDGKVIKDHEAAQAAIAAAVAAIDNNRLAARAARRWHPLETPDRASVRKAIVSVEARLVDATWTLARLPERASPSWPTRTGIDYIHEGDERFAAAVHNGGMWLTTAPRPSPPSSRSIDLMDRVLDWLRWLPIAQARLVMVAATTKRGDPERNIAWGRVRAALPDLGGFSVRRLQQRYHDGLRVIADRLASIS